MNTTDAVSALREWMEALHLITSAPLATGLFGFLGGKAEDDTTVAEAQEFVLDALSDADNVRMIECLTDSDLREQITVEQAITMHEDAEQRRGGWRWN